MTWVWEKDNLGISGKLPSSFFFCLSSFSLSSILYSHLSTFRSSSPFFFRLSSLFFLPSSKFLLLSSFFFPLSSVFRLLSPVFRLLPSVFCLLSFVFRLLSSVFFPLSSFLFLLSSVFSFLPSVFFLLFSVFCLLFYAFCLPCRVFNFLSFFSSSSCELASSCSFFLLPFANAIFDPWIETVSTWLGRGGRLRNSLRLGSGRFTRKSFLTLAK